MQQSIPSPLDELAGKATITIEQTARICSDSAAQRPTTPPAAASCRLAGSAADCSSRSLPCSSGWERRDAGAHPQARPHRPPRQGDRPLVRRRRPRLRPRGPAAAEVARRVPDPSRGGGGAGEARRRVNTGSYVVPGRTTLGEWIRDSWLPMTEPRVKPSTFHSYRRNLEIHVLPALGRSRSSS